MTKPIQKDGQPQEDLGELLGRLGWSGAELARRIDASNSAVYNWLQDRARTPGSVIAYLELALEVRAVIANLGAMSK